MADFQSIIKDIENQIVTLAQNTVSDFKDEAIKDGKQLLATIKEDLARWFDLLSKGDIKPAEFEWLVNSHKELVKMTALQKIGLAESRAAQFGQNILNIAVEVALKKVQG